MRQQPRKNLQHEVQVIATQCPLVAAPKPKNEQPRKRPWLREAQFRQHLALRDCNLEGHSTQSTLLTT